MGWENYASMSNPWVGKTKPDQNSITFIRNLSPYLHPSLPRRSLWGAPVGCVFVFVSGVCMNINPIEDARLYMLKVTEYEFTREHSTYAFDDVTNVKFLEPVVVSPVAQPVETCASSSGSRPSHVTEVVSTEVVSTAVVSTAVVSTAVVSPDVVSPAVVSPAVVSPEVVSPEEVVAPMVTDQVLDRTGSAAGKPVRVFWDRPGPRSPEYSPLVS